MLRVGSSVSSLRWLGEGEMLTGYVVGFVCELSGWGGASSSFCGGCPSGRCSLGYGVKQAFKDLANGDLRRERKDIAGCHSCLRYRQGTYVLTASKSITRQRK